MSYKITIVDPKANNVGDSLGIERDRKDALGRMIAVACLEELSEAAALVKLSGEAQTAAELVMVTYGVVAQFSNPKLQELKELQHLAAQPAKNG